MLPKIQPFIPLFLNLEEEHFQYVPDHFHDSIRTLLTQSVNKCEIVYSNNEYVGLVIYGQEQDRILKDRTVIQIFEMTQLGSFGNTYPMLVVQAMIQRVKQFAYERRVDGVGMILPDRAERLKRFIFWHQFKSVGYIFSKNATDNLTIYFQSLE